MSESYMNAPATKMLATHCVCCGRPLLDATSVEMGIGPECREGNDGGIDADIRKIANEHVFRAAIACQNGEIAKVLEFAGLIRTLGLTGLADKVSRRFVNAERKADITITAEGEMLRVDTPFRRGAKDEFIAAWRKIPGRRWMKDSNYVPVTEKAALFDLLKKFFGGKFAKGPKGVFRIPTPAPEPKQAELALTPA
jgi:hypothetical protein